MVANCRPFRVSRDADLRSAKSEFAEDKTCVQRYFEEGGREALGIPSDALMPRLSKAGDFPRPIKIRRSPNAMVCGSDEAEVEAWLVARLALRDAA